MVKSDYERHFDEFKKLKKEGDIIMVESKSMRHLTMNLAHYRRQNKHVYLRAVDVNGVFKVMCVGVDNEH